MIQSIREFLFPEHKDIKAGIVRVDEALSSLQKSVAKTDLAIAEMVVNDIDPLRQLAIRMSDENSHD